MTDEENIDDKDRASGKMLMVVFGILLILIAIILWAYWRGIVT